MTVLRLEMCVSHGREFVLRNETSKKTAFIVFVALVVSCFCATAVFAQDPAQSAPASFEELAKAATAAREAGKTEQAIQDYKQALEIRQDWSEGWWYLGTMEYDTDRYAEAIPVFQKLVQLSPGLGAAWGFLGLCEFETKNYENSLQHLRKAQELADADDPELTRVSQYHLALLLIRTGDFEQATHSLAATFGQGTISPQVKAALGLVLLRVPLLPEELDPSGDALVHASGEIAANVVKGDTAKALGDFRALIAEHPETPYVRYAYGRALAAAGRLEEALQQEQAELAFSPGSALPRIEISQLQFQLKHPQEALAAAKDAVRVDPNSAAARRALAKALEAAGEKERAEREFEMAQKLPTEKLVPEERIRQLYSLRGTRASAKGVQAATATDSNSTKSFEEFSREATESQKLGNAERAIQTYKKALQLRPDWDDGRWNLAMLYYSGARYREAIEELKNFVALNPNFGTAWAVMGLCEFETEDYKNALIHLERGEELGFGGAPESVRLARCHLAMLLNQDGQFERATQVLAPEAVSSAPTKDVLAVLGLALLRMPVFPVQVEPAKRSLMETAGGISVLLQGSKYDVAFPKFELLLKEFPGTPFLHYAYGTALMALSQYEEAERQMREEIKISPNSDLPYLRLASMALKKHQPAEALTLAQRAVQLAASSAEAHYLFGRASLELGKEEDSIRELEMASRLEPESPEVHFNLAKAYARAKLADKAEQERATFVRLNALAEQRRSQSVNQAYGAHNAADYAPARQDIEKPTPPQRP